MGERKSIAEDEKIGLNQNEVWIVDDEDEILDSIMRALMLDAKKGGIEIKRFSTAQELLEEMQRRQDAKQKIAGTILVDKELRKDDPKLQDGCELVRRIIENQNIDTPNLIAHSAVDEYNERLIEAGANSALKKGQLLAIREIISRLSEGE
ncbi:MAG: hypothetical protein CEN89_538 [Candidatus Berkelbacteria bacterium Licking1014_7]|uniref:Response regulatory domain-containing protein n=1 Tax=Candidatus Berkelbacteria bacterium Licking1014_7 TaxID=2017147 RepID=A0A554LII2_9BACT|nr:MAG: hypothetical protein CEN89_538 [Candidatus Berkelbacteria bacterium Licking1014_7]